MHIPDGVLSVPVWTGGFALSAAGVAVGLRRIDPERVPRVAVMTSAFFVASLIHWPVGPTSVHLILNGLAGVVLGWAAFPAIAVGLLLQCILFGFGGLSALGANTAVMAFPAVIVHYAFAAPARRMSLDTSSGRAVVFASGFAAGAGAIVLSAILLSTALALSDQGLLPAAKLALVANVPIMVVEGFITGFAVLFLKRVRPDILRPALLAENGD